MTLFVNIFVNNVLPAFLVMGTGVLLDRWLHVEKKHLARVALYVLTPCLIFDKIVRSSVDPRQFGLMIAFVVVSALVMCAIGLLVGRALRWPSRATDALVLSIAFINAGNFGLSVVLFAFGEAGLEYASIFYVASSLACYSLAAFFAARSNGGGRSAILKVLRLPGLYAFALAMVLRVLTVRVPNIVMRPTSLIGQAAVPILLMMLGLQLSQTRVGKRYREVAVGVFLRLIVGAAVAVALAPLMGLAGLARQVAITEASTPTAVNSSLMAIEFDADAELVTSVVFVSTLLSSVTLTVLLSFLTS